MEYFLIYLLQFDELRFLALLVLLFLCAISTAAVTMCVIDNPDILDKALESLESERRLYELLKKCTCGLLVALILVALIPSRETLLYIGGLYLGKKAYKQVVTDEKIQKVDTIISLELDKRIKELKNEVRK